MLDQVADALFIVDLRTCRFLGVTRSAEELLGYGRGDLFGRAVNRVFAEDDPSRLRTALEKRPSQSLRSCLKHRHGHDLPVDVTGFLVELAGGEALAVLVRVGDRRPPERSGGDDLEGLIETDLEFPTIIGRSDPIREVCRLIGLVAKTDTTVLVTGESGTGKELVAQAIHFHSHRTRAPLVKVNCAALTDTLLESELFGHSKGAFTGAHRDRKGRFRLAEGGTIILDEIGSMSPLGQAKLLRVLQERELEPVGSSVTVSVNVRVVAITNADLEEEMRAGRFREDLFYRLASFPIRLPPLRERAVDIPPLARHFVKRFSSATRKTIRDIQLDALSRLTDYSWPGNVRELANVIEYGVIVEEESRLGLASLPDKLRRQELPQRSLRERVDLAERKIILEALSKADGVKNRAAKLLGMDRRNLAYFLNKHQICWSPGRMPANSARPQS